MSSPNEVFEDHDSIREEHASTERALELTTPLLQLTRAEGYRWAALDVVDLDPPTWFPPGAAN